jgi:hypothetical protein
LDFTHKRKTKGKKLTRLRGSFPSVQGKQRSSPLLSKRLSVRRNLNWLFSGAFDSYTSEALKKGKAKQLSERAAGVQPVFAIQLSILTRMSFLAGFAELRRPAALTGPALSLQLPKRGIRHES